ncbi:MAG: DUF3892 domain-containing protein [Salinicola sp.]|uniref:DUF3892 domain-containing protein n=1 Tax=Salinicola sp. TaxID=1978524 RepID=UPI001DC7A8E0|nr:DUF3892 domain-containing protein [Salinicola sp.]NRB55413.1 DUF3892 domain-containing protein [Salinicola sp.]
MSKDSGGDITSLCNSNEWWSPRSKQDAINDIENGTDSYYTQDEYGRTANVHVAGTLLMGKYLKTDPDSSCSNNLDNLPDC